MSYCGNIEALCTEVERVSESSVPREDLRKL